MMTLDEKIYSINNPKVTMFKDGYSDTIDDFFNNFIKPRLPNENIIRKWHKLLMEYTDESNFDKISCCVRYGNNGSQKVSNHGEKGYYKLRRGWLTKNIDDDFEYFFADNFFSSFIFKMALDGFCPSLQEFRESFTNHKFPYGFGYYVDKKINEYKGVVVNTGTNPGFLGKYKLSHVFDSGENFQINRQIYNDSILSKKYYDIGHSNDFLKNKDKIRRTKIEYDAKKVIVAKFLRFAHPFNYFLTPLPKLHKCNQKVYRNDIGEDPRMISYVKSYLKKTYPNEYEEFINRIMWYENNNYIEDGSTQIGISYSHTNIKNVNKNIKTNSTTIKHSKRKEIFELIKKYINEKNVVSFNELDKVFPKISSLVSNIKDKTRYFDEIIKLPNGDCIKITNQIGDKPNFPKNRNYSILIEKLKKEAIFM